MKLIGRHPFIVAFVAAVAALAYFVVEKTLEQNGQAGFGGFGATSVVVTQVDSYEFVDSIRALGTTRANESVVITAKVTETVRDVNFQEGANVEKGDVLVELTDEEEAAQLAEARATFEEAMKQYDRIVDLVARGTAAQTRLDTQRALVEQAKARIDAIEVRLADRLIRAPFSGRLGLRQVSPGTLVTPGTAITTLDDISVLKLDFTVPEIYLEALNEGQEVIATTAAFPDESFEGVVTTIDTRIDPATRSVTVRAEIPNDDRRLRPGMLMAINVTRERVVALAVPEEAIINLGESQYVYIVTGEATASRREIAVGRRQPGFAEIASGLRAGETVIVEGHQNLREGQPVRVVGHTDIQGNRLPPEDGTPLEGEIRG